MTHWFTGRHDSAFALALPVEAASLLAVGAGAAAPVIGSVLADHISKTTHAAMQVVRLYEAGPTVGASVLEIGRAHV